jgi:lipopolysaccharide/colanic/teichoic acid biosynthesis glycosyltransferase
LDKQDGLAVSERVLDHVRDRGVNVIVIDLKDDSIRPLLPHLYPLLFNDVRFVDFRQMYEEAFDRIPVSTLGHTWFLENVSTVPIFVYDSLKRAMDLAAACCAGLISLPIYPFVIVAIKLDDRGPVFIAQQRVGKNARTFTLYKFRSMSFNDAGNQTVVRTNRVTRVGGLLRQTRIDELPQLWNVLKGDLSLIGPRPEMPSLAAEYEKSIPYYAARHLIKPGLSGWAQIYHKDPPKVSVDIGRTAMKLSYDLYYIKSRSLMMDIVIALKTVKVLLQRSGR